MRTRWTGPIAGLVVLVLTFGAMVPVVSAQDATPDASPMASPGASPAASPGAGASPVASPSTAGTGETIRSITREQYYQQLREAFQFEEPQSEGGQLIWGEISDIDTTNGLLSDDLPTGYVMGLIFETMVTSSPIDGSVVPALADSYEIAPDGRTYTFRLNEAAKWHDGTDLTADDVVFSLDFATSGESVYAYTSQVDNAVESYRAVDENTVEIVATDVLATFLYDVAGTVFILPRHIWESVPFAEWPQDPGSTGQDPTRVVGTGPFRFQEWAQGDSVTVVKNEEYWDPEATPNVDEIVLRVLPDENTAVQSLTTGEIDILEGVPPAQVEEVQNTEGVEVAVYDTLRFNWYTPNLQLPIFQEREVRQALLYGIDRQLIADEIYLGLAQQANGTQPVLSPSYAPDQIETVYDYNPDQARQLLEQAGWTDSDEDGTVDKDLNGDGAITEDEQLRFDFIYTEGVAIYEQMVPYMQEAWTEIGVDMLPQAVPFPTLQQRLDDGDFGMALLGFSWSPDGGQGIMFRCDSFAPEGFNSMRYCNEQYDQLDDQQLRTLDDEARSQLQVQLSNIVNNDAANGILVFRQEQTGYSERVHNFFPTGFQFNWSWSFVWVEQQ
ncbi:MAG: ABC transporter substrate-binding protein [Chloroflexota bacterium]|nr:ABC transporter substrate-binding protein [Chloroflexota bacterium]